MKRNEKNQAPHGVCVIEGDHEFWTRIGAAWPHQDGKGFNILPMNGRLVVREPKAASANVEAGR
ncbi:hypothetical protein [Bradyrhizobium erythrophlei]|uniref:Uncharacterized protein n=1 Tax=Bradyrhizobium erythrophlei TaxID=1437360 RepID=A0A1H4SFQ0_9BRAD|nr:hypothetical protein [Bradyrhizobium erythrophlei]SEC42890.1 hypothetical protein SAMN05444164_1816 [Bradyrhizobium erythrophlei]